MSDTIVIEIGCLTIPTIAKGICREMPNVDKQIQVTKYKYDKTSSAESAWRLPVLDPECLLYTPTYTEILAWG